MREVKGHIALERVLPPSSPDVLRSISPSQPRRLVCMALLLRLGARLGVTRPRLSFPCDPANVARGGGVTPEGGPPPQRARVIGASTRREMAGDAGGRTPKPQETGNV